MLSFRVNNLCNFFLLVILLCGTFFSMGFMGETSIVVASEEEETDQFVNMPNYRWYNQTSTSGSTEQLIGDNYEIYTKNNETSGTEKFEKSRKLNSRDFYTESRFGLDIGGNVTEHYRDYRGDAVDFTEDGERDQVSGGYMTSWTDSDVTDGVLKLVPTGSNNYLYIYGAPVTSFTVAESFPFSLFDSLQIRVKTESSLKIKAYYSCTDDFWKSYAQTIYSNFDGDDGWVILTFDADDFGTPMSLEGGISSQVRIIRFDVYHQTLTPMPSSAYVYVDWIKLYKKIDFANTVEGEVEDSWDFNDNGEYWYHTENNISDFNDGTRELYTATQGLSVVSDGWFDLYDPYEVRLEMTASGLSVAAATYSWLTFEWYSDSSIDNITILDSADNICEYDATGWVSDTKYLFSADLNANWTGTESQLKIAFKQNTYKTFHVYVNFTFLYNVELGDIEGTTVGSVIQHMYVHPEGYLCIRPAIGGTLVANLFGGTLYDIDTSIFNQVSIRWKAVGDESGVKLKLKAYSVASGEFNLANEDYYTDWTVTTFDMTDNANWLLCSGAMRFTLYAYDIPADYEGTEQIYVDYLLLKGNWSADSQFRFSYLNQDNEEGLSFEFNQDVIGYYNFTVNLFDSVGVVLDFTTSFEYDFATDGWLYFNVECDLDEKQIELDLTYEDGTSIVKKRTWYALFGSSGLSNFLITQDGFPQLCLNNSQEYLSRSWVIIDYIDANYLLNQFYPTAEGEYFNGQLQSDGSNFTSVHHFGALDSNESTTNLWRMYYVDIDRFDGVSFSWSMESEGGDTADLMTFESVLYNVQPDGSLIKVFELSCALGIGAVGSLVDISNRTDVVHRINTGTLTQIDHEGSISMALRDQNEVILQHKLNHVSLSKTDEISVVARDPSYDYTKEFVVLFAYNIYNTFVDKADDQFSIVVSGFDVIRKDILGDFVGNILSPVVDFVAGILSVILSPLIALLLFIVQGITDGLQWLAEALEPFFEDLAAVLTGVLDDLGGILGDLWDVIETLVADIITALVDALDDLTAGLFTELMGLLSELVDVVMGVVFIIYDGCFTVFGATPIDFLAIIDMFIVDLVGAIARIPDGFADLITLFESWTIERIILIAFAAMILLPIIIGESMGQALSLFLKAFFLNISDVIGLDNVQIFGVGIGKPPLIFGPVVILLMGFFMAVW